MSLVSTTQLSINNLALGDLSPRTKPTNPAPSGSVAKSPENQFHSTIKLVYPILFKSHVAHKSFKNLGTHSNIAKALKNNDGNLFEAALIALPKESLEKMRLSPKVSTFIHFYVTKHFQDFLDNSRSIKKSELNEIKATKQFNSIIAPLYDTGIALRASLMMRLLGPNQENSKLVVDVCRQLTLLNQGRLAASILEPALAAGFKVPEVVTLSALALTGQQLKGTRDVQLYGHLALAALKTKSVDPSKARVAAVYDVVLAVLGNPFEMRERFQYRKFYDEKDITDISERMQLAAEIGIELLKSNVRFDTSRTEGRINLLLRGVLRVAATLHCAVFKIEYPDRIHRHIVEREHRKFDISPRYTDLKKPFQQFYVADMLSQIDLLLSNALALAHEGLACTTGAGGRHKIKGSTINLLFRTLANTNMPMDSHDSVLAISVIQNATSTPDIAKKLHSFSVASFINYLVDEYPDQIDMQDAALELTVNLLKVGIVPGKALISRMVNLAEDRCKSADEEAFNSLDLGISSFERISTVFSESEYALKNLNLLKRFADAEPSNRQHRSLGPKSLIGGISGLSNPSCRLFHSFPDLTNAIYPHFVLESA